MIATEREEPTCLSCGSACADERVCGACVARRFGQVLGDRYELTGLLGMGGTGTVFEARHVRIGRRFAVKLLHAQLVRNQTALARFEREARVIGQLESPHIAAVVDFGVTAAELPYIVMERLHGRDLAAALAPGEALPIERALSIAMQACRGVAAAHRLAVIHRDLKPENLFVCEAPSSSGELIKILDFGMAKLHRGGTRQDLTAQGAFMGTPRTEERRV